MTRSLIAKVKIGETNKIQGFVENLRNKRSMAFLVIRDYTGRIQLTIEKEQKSIDDMKDWLERQIAPTIAAVLTANEGDLSWLHEIIGKGAQRLSQRHRDAIAQYLLKK